MAFDQELSATLGEPAKPQQIATLERLIGQTAPPSYRAFLDLHNGWSEFQGNGKLLAVADHGSEWVKAATDMIDTNFAEFDMRSPFEEGAIPVMLGESIQDYLVLDPRTMRSNGEMDFVYYVLTEEGQRFEDFYAFLRNNLRIINLLIENERSGTTSKDDGSERG